MKRTSAKHSSRPDEPSAAEIELDTRCQYCAAVNRRVDVYQNKFASLTTPKGYENILDLFHIL